MLKYAPLLRRAFAGRDNPTAEERQAVYERAHQALLRCLSNMEPRPSKAKLDQETQVLKSSIALVEAEYGREDAFPALDLDITPTPSPPPVSPGLTPPVDPEAPQGEPGGRRQLAVNAAAGGVANLVKIGIQLLLLPIMAHLLGPAEFGLYALALPTISFFSVLADGGLGASLAREPEGSAVVWSTAFWVLLGTGFVLTGVITSWGLGLSILAHQPRLAGIMAFLSTSFILITMSVIPSARLTRRGNLVIGAGADLASTSLGAVVAVGLAASGAGAWSLAAQYVAGFLVRAVILNAAAFYRPSLIFRLSSLRHHLHTGSALLGGRLFDLAGRLTENLVFGRTFGTAALGTYTFANQTPRFICEAAANPLWAALYAHALREEDSGLAAMHHRLSRLLASVIFPAAFLLSASAPQLLNLMLGAKWAPAAVLIQILVPFYALNVVAAQSTAILLANARNAILFWSVAGVSLARVAAVFCGLWTGPVGVAWGIGLSNVLFAAVMFVAPARPGSADTRHLVQGIIPPLVASMMAGLACYALLLSRPDSIVWIALSLGGGGVTYLLALFAMEGKRLRSDFFSLKQIVMRRRLGGAF